MPWIAVHEQVLGGKLRGLRKIIKCSEAESLGILTILWLWARKNVDVSGLIVNADKEDVADAIRHYLSENLNAYEVVEALVETGWIDDIDGSLYIHDWYEWQQYWYSYLDKKEKDKLRKRAERERHKEAHSSEAQEDTDGCKPEEGNDTAIKKKKKSETDKKKVKYAESVSMLEEEHQKLVDNYGSEFTEKAIEELNNYKLATGKKYKEDYRAILNWVIDRCKSKYPHLMKPKPEPVQESTGSNPFEDYK